MKRKHGRRNRRPMRLRYQAQRQLIARTGRTLSAKRLGRQFRQLLRRAELPTFKLYDLRHTFASHLLAGNADAVR